jgi:hypothetical protein
MGPGHASTSSVSSTVGGSGVSDLEPAPDSDSTSVRYLALDTNVLLNHFALVKSLHGRLLCGDSWLLVPATVISGEYRALYSDRLHILTSELDGLKASNKPTQPGSRLSIGDVARSATAWMLDLVRSEKRGAPVRLRVESWSDAAKTQPGARSADATILACCIHYRASGPVTLWTNDRNLALLAETNGIPSVDGRVGLARLCAALGIEDNGELEAMDVDGSGVSVCRGKALTDRLKQTTLTFPSSHAVRHTLCPTRTRTERQASQTSATRHSRRRARWRLRLPRRGFSLRVPSKNGSGPLRLDNGQQWSLPKAGQGSAQRITKRLGLCHL